MVEVMRQQQEKLSAALRRATEKIEKLESSRAKPDEPEKPEKQGPIARVNERVNALEEARKVSEAKQAKTRLSSLRSSVRTTLTDSGVDPALVQMASDALLARVAGNVRYEDDDLSGEVAVVTIGAEEMTVEQFVKEHLASPEGKALVARAAAPSLSGIPKGRGTPAGVRRVSREDMKAGKFSLDEVLAGKVVLDD